MNKVYKDAKGSNHVIHATQDYLGGWCAYTENYDGAPDAGPQLEGYGGTESSAIDDLIECIEVEL